MDSYKQLKLKIAYIIKCTAGLNIDIRDDINIGRLSIINNHIQEIGRKINTTFSTQFSEKVLLQSSISQIAEMIMNPGMAMYKGRFY